MPPQSIDWCQKRLGLAQSRFQRGLAHGAGIGVSTIDLAYREPEYVVIILDATEAGLIGWQPGCYLLDAKPKDAVTASMSPPS
jgi:hypothetical protein